jgi:hypothetical protein
MRGNHDGRQDRPRKGAHDSPHWDPPGAEQSLDDLLALAKIPDTWDILIVGDGAGCGWNLPCGWGCTLVDRHAGRRRAFYGGLSSGSIAIAELMPAVHAMLWYHRFHGKARRAQLGTVLLDVHVVTDNKPTAIQWRTLIAGGAKAQKIRDKLPLWDALLRLERSGYMQRFHWLARNRVGLNVLADEVAGGARDAIAEVRLRPRDGVERSLDHEIYTINPSELLT